MPRTVNQPFMIGRSADGRYRVIRRQVLYNDEGYPLIATTIAEPGFSTAADARSHALAPPAGPDEAAPGDGI